MADVIDGSVAVEVSKPEVVDMEVVKAGEEEIDAGTKGLKRKLEESVVTEEVKQNGNHEVEEKNGHNEKSENGTNGSHAEETAELKDSPSKKAKIDEAIDEAVAEKVEKVTGTTEEEIKPEEIKEDLKNETEEIAVVAEAEKAVVVESTEEEKKETKEEEKAAEAIKDDEPAVVDEKVPEVDAADIVAAEEKAE